MLRFPQQVPRHAAHGRTVRPTEVVRPNGARKEDLGGGGSPDVPEPTDAPDRLDHPDRYESQSDRLSDVDPPGRERPGTGAIAGPGWGFGILDARTMAYLVRVDECHSFTGCHTKAVFDRVVEVGVIEKALSERPQEGSNSGDGTVPVGWVDVRRTNAVSEAHVPDEFGASSMNSDSTSRLNLLKDRCELSSTHGTVARDA